MSRRRPVTRETIVIAPTNPAARAICRFSLIDDHWVGC
jgi:hypothetical protein